MASGIRLTMDILRNRLSNINPNIEIVSNTYKKREYARSKNIDLLEINYDDDIEEKLNIYFKTKSRND